MHETVFILCQSFQDAPRHKEASDESKTSKTSSGNDLTIEEPISDVEEQIEE